MTSGANRTHAAVECLAYEDGILQWGGRKVTEIANEIGQTPFYAYSKRILFDRVAALRKIMPEELRIHYAMKANPMPEVVTYMSGLVDGLDVASEGELEVALKTKTRVKDISFAGPGKRDAELSAAVKAGITINIESENEMRRIAQICEATGNQADLAIRVNPAFELRFSGMKMGGRPSPFGIDAERVPAMLNELESIGLNFRGFHIFSGSQNLRPESINETLAETVKLVLTLASETSLNVSYINLGGGLGIPYFPGEKVLDQSQICDAYSSAVDVLTRNLDAPELITELGRYLVGEAGIYVCKVVDIKESRGTRFAICDGGLHHHLAASGNFGQVIRKNYPVVSVDKNNGPDEQTVTVVGPLCTPLDLIGDRVNLHPLMVGSLIAVLQSGAYGKTASPEMFLSHPQCVEVFI